MKVDHAALDQEFKALAAANPQSGVDGVVNPPADSADLSKLSGNSLEKAYVEREAKAHQAMLAALDRQLIPNAKDEQLQRRLIDLRGEVSAHLDNAQSLQHTQSVRELQDEERALISREIGNSGP
jgi:predicted outer membrane protein